jgi:hypothetical protein
MTRVFWEHYPMQKQPMPQAPFDPHLWGESCRDLTTLPAETPFPNPGLTHWDTTTPLDELIH